MEMNPAIKARWAEALRSGVYRQGNGYLAKTSEGDTKYCCLGVLCELAMADGVVSAKMQFGGVKGYEGDVSLLPYKIMDWAGLDERDPEVNGIPMSVYNDTHRYDFAHIANLIEGSDL